MTHSVHQHWDPLKVCVVGRSYPPEFYSWIKVPHVRSLFEKIAIETEEDYQKIIKKLQEFDVDVLRPNLPNTFNTNHFVPPPMTPRDTMIMIGDVLYHNWDAGWKNSYDKLKGPDWPQCYPDTFDQLPDFVKQELTEWFGSGPLAYSSVYQDILNYVEQQGNQIKSSPLSEINGAMVSRIGRDLYFGTNDYDQDLTDLKKFIDKEFIFTRNHIVNTGGHSDGTYCPVCPGLIISLLDVPTYADTFPGWEVIYLPNQSWGQVHPFLDLKTKNSGRWWIPGFEYDQDVINVVETWMNHWVGYVEETVFDVNMLIIDPKNVMVFNYNKKVFDALERYGITPHIVNFRHRYFWDGGIHCVTCDLHREGAMQDYFSGRG